MTTPTWPELLKREAGLRPEGVEVPDEDDAKYTEPGEMFVWAGVVDEGVRGRVAISAEHAADLCGFAAVKWLVSLGQPWFVASGTDPGMSIYIDSKIGEPFNRRGPFSGTTLDEALRSACDAALKAQGKP